MSTHDALRLIRQAVNPDPGRPIRYGTVTDVEPLNVQWDGETAPDTVTYPALATYLPVLGDKVMAVRDVATWVIVAAVGPPRIGYAARTDTTSAGLGQIVFTHGLPFTPSVVQLTPVTDCRLIVGAVSATQITVTARNGATGGALLSTPVTFYWTAYA